MDETAKDGLPEWVRGEAEPVEGTGACRDYGDLLGRTRRTVPEGALDGSGGTEAFGSDPADRCLDRVAVRDGGHEAILRAGVTVEVEI